ncbi:glutamine amidotransferase [Arcobacteraceae bacterium]|nr:glutamine amidotransferase [Arcobacteraceae bacterium]
MKKIYILKTGKTFSTTKSKMGDFDDWVINYLEKSNQTIKVIDVLNNKKLPILKSAAGFIITGSHSMVSEELSWSVTLEKYIKKINSKNVPLLGICYGHQLISKALGGESGYNKKGKEIGTVKIIKSKSANDDLLLKGFPKQFYAFETHYQSVLKLPRKSVILFSNDKDQHQSVRFSSSTWGVQFHPEFDKKVMEEYILNQDADLKKLGFNIENLITNMKRCDKSHKILTNFMRIVKLKK